MAKVQIGSKPVGSKVFLKVNGTPRSFVIVHQGKPSAIYDESCNGTWLLMEDIYTHAHWNFRNKVNNYATSDVFQFLNNDFFSFLDANIRNIVKNVRIPYRAGAGTDKTVTSGAQGLRSKVFLLSAEEVNYSGSFLPINEGAPLKFFQDCLNYTADPKRAATENSEPQEWWLRSPCCVISNGTTTVMLVRENGDVQVSDVSNFTEGVRPAFVIPSTTMVDDNGNVITNQPPSAPTSITLPSTIKGGASCSVSWSGPAFVIPSTTMVDDNGNVITNQPPSAPTSITLPSTIKGGASCSVSWSVASDPDGNLEGYIVERSYNGGSSWSQIYQGSATSTSTTIPHGTSTVMFRVCAYDTDGEKSGWRTSSNKTVLNNRAPNAPPSINVPVSRHEHSHVPRLRLRHGRGEIRLAHIVQ